MGVSFAGFSDRAARSTVSRRRRARPRAEAARGAPDRPERESPNGSFPILAPLACPPHKSFVQRKEGSTRRVRITSSRRRCVSCASLSSQNAPERAQTANFGEMCRGCPPDDPDDETPLESFSTPAFRCTRPGNGQLSGGQESTKEVDPRRARDEKQPSGNPSTAPHPAARMKTIPADALGRTGITSQRACAQAMRRLPSRRAALPSSTRLRPQPQRAQRPGEAALRAARRVERVERQGPRGGEGGEGSERGEAV